MSELAKQTCRVWGFLWLKHSYLITNAFVTLLDQNKVDVVKSCTVCGEKDIVEMDRETLLEVVVLYPNAFEPILHSYLLTWIS